MPLNRAIYDEDTHEIIDIVAGDFLIVYAPFDSENYESLPKDLMEKYKEMYEKPEEFFRINGEIKATSVNTQIKSVENLKNIEER